MSTDQLRALQQALFNAYGGNITRRGSRNIDQISFAFDDRNESNVAWVGFVIDDRNASDVASDGTLYSYFCHIVAEIIDEHTIKVSLSGNVPQGIGVEEWCRHYLEDIYEEQRLVFNVTSADADKLCDLARAIRSIVGGGARYKVPNYRYVCPRTATSLMSLQAILAEHWAGTHKLETRRQA